MQTSLAAPQVLGTTVSWTASATDTNTGPLTFQFNICAPGGTFALARDFNLGNYNSGVWTSTPFVWTPTKQEGYYQIQVVIKDFASGESISKSAYFQVTPLVTAGAPVVVPTGNPLVALFSSPACPAGSTMRVVFQQQPKKGALMYTNMLACRPPLTMNFEVAGMYPTTTYTMLAQTITGTTVTNGTSLTFTSGSIPTTIPLPPFRTTMAPTAQADTSVPVLFYSPVQLGGQSYLAAVATDMSGRVLWYNYPNTADHFELITRPLVGTYISIQNDLAWNPLTTNGQVLRQIDYAGNIIRETNIGVIQQQLLAKGAVNGGPCNTFSSPAPVGAGCLGAFHHDAIQALPNGWTAVLANLEQIFPPGTQGDTSGLPVDIIGDMIIVLDTNWQVQWFFDTFQHDGGGSQLDINRPAVLGETCAVNQSGCPPMFLLGAGIAPLARDWLHANSLYYEPQDGSIIWSSRHQDWLLKVDYGNGSGTGNILWRMGQGGDFTFNNVYNDPWPWFSHQHDAGLENNGAGPLTIYDDGNTRVSQAPLGLGYGNSRGMALNMNESGLQVSPVLSSDLGVLSSGLGSAQLLSNGNYFFLAPAVSLPNNKVGSYSIEILPTPNSAAGTAVYDLLTTEAYRVWRMPTLYLPPTT